MDHSELLFRRVEALRISLAKHEVPRSGRKVALAPGYGRIDGVTGSITWEIVLRDKEVDMVSRRRIADECRHFTEDRSSRILPLVIQQKLAGIQRNTYALTFATVILADGKVYKDVFVAWGKEVVFVRGEDEMPFDAREIVDVKAQDNLSTT